MRHLAPEAMLDIVEGVPADASLVHLRECAACRTQVEALSATLLKVTEVEVPEPSPLFWDHLSARVGDAVKVPPDAGGSWSAGWLSWSLAGTFGVALLLIVAGVSLRQAPVVPAAAVVAPPANPFDDATVTVGTVDDASLSLLADLASDLDWDGAAAAGLAVQVGSVDRVLVELSDPERTELQRLLTAELAAGRTL